MSFIPVEDLTLKKTLQDDKKSNGTGLAMMDKSMNQARLSPPDMASHSKS